MKMKNVLLTAAALLFSLMLVLFASAAEPDHEHVAGEPRRENNVSPTCAVEGSYDSVVYCEVCGEELQRVKKVIPVLTYHIAESSLKRTLNRDEAGHTVVTFEDPSYAPLVKSDTLPEAYVGVTLEADRFLAGDGTRRSCADGEERCAVCGELLNPTIPHLWDKGAWTSAIEEYPWNSYWLNRCLVCGCEGMRHAGLYYPYGDVDGDYEVTTEDARLALRAAVNLEQYDPTSREFYCADYGEDGTISAEDARSILRTAVKMLPRRMIGNPSYIDPDDISGDGRITAADARIVLRYSVGYGNYDKIITEQNYYIADADRDGKVTSADARILLRIAVGLPV